MTIYELNNKKIIKEYLYLKSEYELIDASIKDAEHQFLLAVDNIVSTDENLKELYYEKFTKRVNDKIDESISSDGQENKEWTGELCNGERHQWEDIISEREAFENKNDYREDSIKKIYRKIVKITHPDHTNIKELNNIYIKANKFYDSNDITSLYEICDQLDIEYNISNIENIKLEIDEMKNKIKFLEKNIIWSWINSNEKEKPIMVINFLKKELLS